MSFQQLVLDKQQEILKAEAEECEKRDREFHQELLRFQSFVGLDSPWVYGDKGNYVPCASIDLTVENYRHFVVRIYRAGDYARVFAIDLCEWKDLELQQVDVLTAHWSSPITEEAIASLVAGYLNRHDIFLFKAIATPA